MSEFMLEPESVDAERPDPQRPGRAVTTSLADTADVPASAKRGADRPPCYGPCPACGGRVLRGMTSAGVLLLLDPTVRTYTVLWLQGDPMPTFAESRAYPVHRCTEGD